MSPDIAGNDDNDLPDTGPVADNTPTAPTISAVTTAFGITELLIEILSYVPPYKKTALLRVSKDWNDVLTHEGLHFDPVHAHRVDYPFSGHPATYFPAYAKDITYTHHPAFKRLDVIGHKDYKAYNDPSGERTCSKLVWVGFDLFGHKFDKDVKGTKESRDEFITDPPISQIVLQTGSDPRAFRLVVAGGIRVGHLLDARRHLPAMKARQAGSAWYVIC